MLTFALAQLLGACASWAKLQGVALSYTFW